MHNYAKIKKQYLYKMKESQMKKSWTSLPALVAPLKYKVQNLDEV